MMNSDVVFVLIYILFVICVLHPPVEVVSAGLTVPALFASFLGSENAQFVQYHIKRTCLMLLVYSLLPLLFVGGLHLFVSEYTSGLHQLLQSQPIIYKLALTSALGLPVLALAQIYMYWRKLSKHPIVKALEKFTNANSNFESISQEINNEYSSRENKLCIQQSTITKIIVTRNWIVKVVPLHVHFAHQSDATLSVKHSVTQDISLENAGVTQYLTIEVKSERNDTFLMRLNALDFQDLQNRIARSIAINPEVQFHRSVIDKFTCAFKEAIKENAHHIKRADELSNCIGCMQSLSNVKLQRYCDDSTTERNCTSCNCKPMWCVDCIASWFAHRQDESQVDTWLSSKCTCPTCRATFCILDVCPIIIQD